MLRKYMVESTLALFWHKNTHKNKLLATHDQKQSGWIRLLEPESLHALSGTPFNCFFSSVNCYPYHHNRNILCRSFSVKEYNCPIIRPLKCTSLTSLAIRDNFYYTMVHANLVLTQYKVNTNSIPSQYKLKCKQVYNRLIIGW